MGKEVGTSDGTSVGAEEAEGHASHDFLQCIEFSAFSHLLLRAISAQPLFFHT